MLKISGARVKWRRASSEVFEVNSNILIPWGKVFSVGSAVSMFLLLHKGRVEVTGSSLSSTIIKITSLIKYLGQGSHFSFGWIWKLISWSRKLCVLSWVMGGRKRWLGVRWFQKIKIKAQCRVAKLAPVWDGSLSVDGWELVNLR